MIKHDEERFGTWLKVAENEPVFVLRAQDKTAATIVRIWCQVATMLGVDGAKVNEAYDLADSIEAWQKRNAAKLPD